MDFLANPTHSFCCYSTGHIAPGELICVLVREWQWMANNASYYDENFWSCGSSLPPAKSSGGLQGLMEHTLRTHTLDIKPRKIRTISICSVRVTLYTRLPSPKVSVYWVMTMVAEVARQLLYYRSTTTQQAARQLQWKNRERPIPQPKHHHLYYASPRLLYLYTLLPPLNPFSHLTSRTSFSFRKSGWDTFSP